MLPLGDFGANETCFLLLVPPPPPAAPTSAGARCELDRGRVGEVGRDKDRPATLMLGGIGAAVASVVEVG